MAVSRHGATPTSSSPLHHFPGLNSNDWLGDIVKKIRDGGEEHPAFALYDELDAINDYTKEHHHGENLHDVAEAPIDRVELTGFVRRTLQIVNASTA